MTHNITCVWCPINIMRALTVPISFILQYTNKRKKNIAFLRSNILIYILYYLKNPDVISDSLYLCVVVRLLLFIGV